MMKGKEYVVEDGDIIFFKFNKPNPSKKKWLNKFDIKNSIVLFIAFKTCSTVIVTITILFH
jgi:hypothetical protein